MQHQPQPQAQNQTSQALLQPPVQHPQNQHPQQQQQQQQQQLSPTHPQPSQQPCGLVQPVPTNVPLPPLPSAQQQQQQLQPQQHPAVQPQQLSPTHVPMHALPQANHVVPTSMGGHIPAIPKGSSIPSDLTSRLNMMRSSVSSVGPMSGTDLEGLADVLKTEITASLSNLVDSIVTRFVHQRRFLGKQSEAAAAAAEQLNKDLLMASQLLDRKSPRTKISQTDRSSSIGGSQTGNAPMLSTPSLNNAPQPVPMGPSVVGMSVPPAGNGNCIQQQPPLANVNGCAGARLNGSSFPTMPGMPAMHVPSAGSTLDPKGGQQVQQQQQQQQQLAAAAASMNSIAMPPHVRPSPSTAMFQASKTPQNINSVAAAALYNSMNQALGTPSQVNPFCLPPPEPREHNPEQNEALSLVVTPKKKRHKVTDTRITPRTVSRILAQDGIIPSSNPVQVDSQQSQQPQQQQQQPSQQQSQQQQQSQPQLPMGGANNCHGSSLGNSNNNNNNNNCSKNNNALSGQQQQPPQTQVPTQQQPTPGQQQQTQPAQFSSQSSVGTVQPTGPTTPTECKSERSSFHGSASSMLPVSLPTSVAIPNPSLHESQVFSPYSPFFNPHGPHGGPHGPQPSQFHHMKVSSSPPGINGMLDPRDSPPLPHPPTMLHPALLAAHHGNSPDYGHIRASMDVNDRNSDCTSADIAYNGMEPTISFSNQQFFDASIAANQSLTPVNSSTLTPMHLRKAKLMFFWVRYPSSAVLKMYFPDIKFNKNNTAQLVKWFSNFRDVWLKETA
uniref:Prospero domain-containing protein n=1 Tax=Anopheles christyi TaxID=43041 RepID=A0A182KAE2_9DIPT